MPRIPAKLQSIVISRGLALNLADARKIAKHYLGNRKKKIKLAKYDRTSTSYRFRQINPDRFASFRTKMIVPGVSLVYGIL